MSNNTERIYIRICHEDKELISSLAKELNMNISSFIKFCIAVTIADFGDDKND